LRPNPEDLIIDRIAHPTFLVKSVFACNGAPVLKYASITAFRVEQTEVLGDVSGGGEAQHLFGIRRIPRSFRI
jgi:hypothetical protein